MSQESIDEKIERALRAPAAGNVIFSDEELETLRSTFPYHITPQYIAHMPMLAERLFVYIVNLTQRNCRENLGWIFTDNVDYEVFHTYDQIDYYQCMHTLFDVLVDKVLLIQNYRKTKYMYRTTFMYHALVPNYAMKSFFEFCWNLYFDSFNFNKNYIDDYNVYFGIALTFANRYFNAGYYYDDDDDYPLDAFNFKFIGKSYNFRIGLIVMCKEYPNTFASLIQKFVMEIDRLYHGEHVDTDASYINRLIVEYYQDFHQEMFFRSHRPERYKKPYSHFEAGYRDKPNLYYKRIKGHIMLTISRFGFTYYRIDPVNFVIQYRGEDVYRGKIRIDNEGDSAFSVTESTNVDVTNLLKENPDAIKCLTVVIKDPSRDDSEEISVDVKRSFILFPVGDDVSEIYNDSTHPGDYCIFMPNINSAEFGHGGTTLWSNFVKIYLQDGLQLSCEDNFVDINTLAFYDSVLIGKNNNAIFKYNGASFGIYSQIVVRLRADVPISQYVLSVAHDNSVGEDISYNLSSYMEKTQEGYRYQYVFLNIPLEENVPLRVVLFDLSEGKTTDRKSLIFIPGFKITCDKPIYIKNDDIVCCQITTNNGSPINAELPFDSLKTQAIPFYDGEIAITNLPTISVSFDNIHLFPISRFPSRMYYREFYKKGLYFESDYRYISLTMEDGQKLDTVNVYDFLSNYHENHPEIISAKILLHVDDTSDPIPFTEVFFWSSFIENPVSFSGNIMHWNPRNYIGPDNSQIFVVRFYCSFTKVYETEFLRGAKDVEIPRFTKLGVYTYKVQFAGSDENTHPLYEGTI